MWSGKPRTVKSGGEGALSFVTKPCFQLLSVAERSSRAPVINYTMDLWELPTSEAE
jgi:hypothetical protein